MARENTVRRLAAILSADVVGYSRLMGIDEAGTLGALRAHRAELIDPTIVEHNGRIVKLIGDGLLVEFASAIDAVECAVAIQQGMAVRNANVPDERMVVFRIGINLGDVIIEGDDIYGDGVNVAARLQELAEPGGVFVSGTIFEQVDGKVDQSFVDLGNQQFKNINKLVRVYSVSFSSVSFFMAASIALDMSSASQMKSEMQAAANSAVLAAATRLAVNASDGDKEQLALDTFYANLSPVLAEHAGTPSVEIDFPAKQVHLAVSLEKQAVLTTLVSDGSIISVEATATIAPGTPICMMALNPHVEKALTIQGTADLMATDCAVHVNSDDTDNALHQHGSATATADSFCVHGGYSGDNFTPSPEKCGYETDPLLASFLADWAKEEISSWPCKETNFPQINTGAITDLAPGVYCGGLTIKKGTVQLRAGGNICFS